MRKSERKRRKHIQEEDEDVWMYGWMDGWMDEWMEGCIVLLRGSAKALALMRAGRHTNVPAPPATLLFHSLHKEDADR